MTSVHLPVFLEKSLEYLINKPNGVYVDCTLGNGGHFTGIAGRLSLDAQLIGIDADPSAIEYCREHLTISQKYFLENTNFSNLKQVCFRFGYPKVDGILFDLGLSSFELDNPERGFSFSMDGPLDMRFSPDIASSAETLINTASASNLSKIFKEYGEERFTNRIARAIVQTRADHPITTTSELVKIIKGSTSSSFPVKTLSRIFQAIRIYVNRELDVLEDALGQALDILNEDGRLVVISYHSLEDRIVKTFMKQEASDCICPKDFPICQCQHKATLEILTPHPIKPTEDEIKHNSRARSAKLRACRKRKIK